MAKFQNSSKDDKSSRQKTQNRNAAHSYQRPKSNGNKPKSKDKDGASGGSSTSMCSTNDPAWYVGAHNALIESAFGFNWTTPAGVTLNASSTWTGTVNDGQVTCTVSNSTTGDYIAFPSIMSIEIAPCAGYSDMANSVLNYAAEEQYTIIRSNNSGAKNYNRNDLMLRMLCMADVYSYINYLIRGYSVCTTYSVMNRAYPKALLRAMGIDYEDQLGWLPRFRSMINTLIAKAQSIVVPASISVFQRRAFLFSAMYRDSQDVRSQLYMYNPDGFLQFGYDSDSAGMLKYKAFNPGSTVRTLDQLFAFGNELIDAVYASEDIEVISGDILKAYGQNVLKLNEIPESVPMQIYEDYWVLDQMRNADVIGTFGAALNLDVTQDSNKNHLISEPYVTLQAYSGQWNRYSSAFNNSWVGASCAAMALSEYNKPRPLVSGTVNTDLKWRLEATRLKFTVDPLPSEIGIYTAARIRATSEIATKVYIVRPTNSGVFVTADLPTFRIGLNPIGFTSVELSDWIGKSLLQESIDSVELEPLYDHFKFKPLCYKLGVSYNASASDKINHYYTGRLVDADNWTLISPQTLNVIDRKSVV